MNVISFRVKDILNKESELEIAALEKDEKIENTVRLLKDVYYGTTKQKEIEANVMRRELRKNVSKFIGVVRDYLDAEGEEKEDLKFLIKRELKNSSEYSAFKRWVIWDHKNICPELLAFFLN